MTPPTLWTEERILEGLNRYFQTHGRYPTARDFDTCDYLPTARQVQRRFPGGLPALRAKLTPDAPTNHTKGEIRSEVARKNIQRSYKYEEEFYNFLTGIFEEKLVHEQKRLRPGDIACDFYIYTSNHAGIAVDLFYAKDIFNLIGIVNIKLKRYITLPSTQKIYFVSILNPVISQSEIEKVIGNRRNALPKNVEIVEEGEFRERIKAR